MHGGDKFMLYKPESQFFKRQVNILAQKRTRSMHSSIAGPLDVP